MGKIKEAELRFWDKVNFNSGIFGENGKYPTECWTWNGNLCDGYGNYYIKDIKFKAHRFIAELSGIIPPGYEIDHLCRNRACVRPSHLEIVTKLVNVLRGKSPFVINKNKTHCKNGHEFTPDNILSDQKGNRRCKICVNEYKHNWYLKNKESK